ncbi:hypothetical protein MHPYR_340044 [uncultured Mycobacterium sp.]|uniref:Uncharacterized protein n=1 Tax=uncultured Mycobacterium sp. TaxID=171292 RepID=A0A1Y5PD46_9MYCO|nr:hypothetical protein MHPYR_340044 [uncultured Mycobacterium sp.]
MGWIVYQLSIEMGDVPLREAVAGLEDVAHAAIPHALLPRRLTLYTVGFPRWVDVASESLRASSKRPKLGRSAVRAVVVAAGDPASTAAAVAGADHRLRRSRGPRRGPGCRSKRLPPSWANP